MEKGKRKNEEGMLSERVWENGQREGAFRKGFWKRSGVRGEMGSENILVILFVERGFGTFYLFAPSIVKISSSNRANGNKGFWLKS